VLELPSTAAARKEACIVNRLEMDAREGVKSPEPQVWEGMKNCSHVNPHQIFEGKVLILLAKIAMCGFCSSIVCRVDSIDTQFRSEIFITDA